MKQALRKTAFQKLVAFSSIQASRQIHSKASIILKSNMPLQANPGQTWLQTGLPWPPQMQLK